LSLAILLAIQISKQEDFMRKEGVYKERCMVVMKILNFEGLNVATLVIDTKF
jgi:hypothetical protein